MQPLLGSLMINGEKVYLEYEGHLVDKCKILAPLNSPDSEGEVESSNAAEMRGNLSKRDIGPRMVVS
ncbi:hypothetical protein V2J09_021030 [Rumex salicifolius]